MLVDMERHIIISLSLKTNFCFWEKVVVLLYEERMTNT